jgi:hypothetical protein
MDDDVPRFARELADAIAAAVASSADVERCRERVRQAGYTIRLSLEATVGFAAIDGSEAAAVTEAASPPSALPAFEVTPNDRRFLRSLRIAANEVNVEESSG